MTEERRRFHRIEFDAPASLTLASGQIETLIIDCSLHGVMVRPHADWQPREGEAVELSLQLDNDPTSAIQMQTEVKRISADSIGLACQHIDLESITRLRRLVELNLGDSTLLERDLEHLVGE